MVEEDPAEVSILGALLEEVEVVDPVEEQVVLEYLEVFQSPQVTQPSIVVREEEVRV
jgi:hypothetical protein